MAPTCGAGITAAAGTSLSHHLFSKICKPKGYIRKCPHFRTLLLEKAYT